MPRSRFCAIASFLALLPPRTRGESRSVNAGENPEQEPR